MKLKNIILSILLSVCMLAGGFGIYALNSASVPVSNVEDRADAGESGNTSSGNYPGNVFYLSLAADGTVEPEIIEECDTSTCEYNIVIFPDWSEYKFTSLDFTAWGVGVIAELISLDAPIYVLIPPSITTIAQDQYFSVIASKIKAIATYDIFYGEDEWKETAEDLHTYGDSILTYYIRDIFDDTLSNASGASLNNITKIEANTLGLCSQLTSIYLNADVEIAANEFDGCDNLQYIIAENKEAYDKWTSSSSTMSKYSDKLCYYQSYTVQCPEPGTAHEVELSGIIRKLLVLCGQESLKDVRVETTNDTPYYCVAGQGEERTGHLWTNCNSWDFGGTHGKNALWKNEQGYMVHSFEDLHELINAGLLTDYNFKYIGETVDLYASSDFTYDTAGTTVTGFSASGMAKVASKSSISVMIPSVSTTGATVTKIGNNAFSGSATTTSETNRKIKNIVFPDTLEEIGTWAFGGLTLNNLANAEIVFPSSLKVIGAYAFTGSNSIVAAGDQSIDSKASTTDTLRFAFKEGSQLQRIEAYAFSQCRISGYFELPASLTYIDKDAFNILM